MIKKFTSTIIANYLNNYHEKFYLGELATLLKKPHQTIKPYIESLVIEGIFIKEERKNIIDYALNFKDRKVYEYLIIAEKEKLLNRLKEDTIISILYEKLSPFFSNNIFIIFGSAAEKTLKGSDIDLLVIGKADIANVVDNFEKLYSKKVHKIQARKMGELTMTLIKEIYKKHLILSKTEDVIRFLGELHENNKLV